MVDKSNDPQVTSRPCSNWTEIAQCLEEFPSQEVTLTEGEVERREWVFRGLTDSSFHLEPTIERQARDKSMSWGALEELVADEFKSRARMHLNPAFVPGSREELTWLALMQHYGAPSRLLDFTYSPFVALYFAIRKQENERDRSQVLLWAVNAAKVNERFDRVINDAALATGDRIRHTAPSRRSSFSTDRDTMMSDTQERHELIGKALLATGTRRKELKRHGCVAVASPPSFNPRLASQQGVFLVNCAEELTFGESLSKMMSAEDVDFWCKRFDIVIDALPEIEERLFQMNIHEQSLFPDMEGLAGYIRQKIRLHWR